MTIHKQPQFFIICPIGFEEIQRLEIISWSKHLKINVPVLKTVKGGVEVQADSMTFARMIPYLKVATRVLLRISAFKVRDFPKLFNKVKKFDWGPYLYKSEDTHIQVTLRKSRLIHSNRAKESIEEGIKTWLKGNPRKKITEESPKQQLYFHIEEDVCQISIDLCGSPLYRRENKTQGAMAPIRENLACGMILWTLSQLDKKENLTLIDPMCGSGTFIVESAFLTTPNLSKKLSAHFILATKNEFKDLPTTQIKTKFSRLIGIDKNKSFQPGREEMPGITYINNDYQNVLSELPDGSIFVFNPPYGKRIKIIGERVEYYKKVVQDLFSTDAKAVGFVIPEEVPLKLKIDHTNQNVLRFRNGGLPVKFILLTKK